METVYFQTKNIDKKYCEFGIFTEIQSEYIYSYSNQEKILLKDVKIIDKANVYFDWKIKKYCVKELKTLKRLRGRPKTGTVAYHRNIPPEIKEKLDKCLTTLKIEYYANINN
jgi:hypothetical protein